jgi:hypothetical protein
MLKQTNDFSLKLERPFATAAGAHASPRGIPAGTCANSENSELGFSQSEWSDLSDQFENSRTHFLAQLTHEIRTPLTSLLMGLHLLKKNQSDFGASKQWVDICFEEGERLRQLVEQLLKVSRIDQPKCKNPEYQVSTSLKKVLSLVLNRTRSEALLRELLYSPSAVALIEEQQAAEESFQFHVNCEAERLDWSLEQILVYIIRNASRNERIHLDLQFTEDQTLVLWFELQRLTVAPASDVWLPNTSSYQLHQGRVSYAGMSMALDLMSAMNYDFCWEKRESPLALEASAPRSWHSIERVGIAFRAPASSLADGARPEHLSRSI